MAKKQKSKFATDRAQYLIARAVERQTLGLSVSEYNALTPFEIACELEAQRILGSDNERLFNALKLLDLHLSTIEILLNGFKFPNAKTLADFRLLKDERQKKPSKKTIEKRISEVSAVLKLADEFLKKRDEIRAKRKQK